MAITYKTTTVTVTKNGQDYSETYQQIEKSSVTPKDLMDLITNPDTQKKFINDWWYGQDLKAKAVVRQSIDSRMLGPEKAMDKLVKDFIAMFKGMGQDITEAQARVLVQNAKETKL